MLELTSAAFFFIFGLLIVALGYWAEKNSRIREFLLISGGIIFLVTGIWTLSGQVIQTNDYTFSNYTYANFTQFMNSTTVNNTGFVSNFTNTTSIVPILTGINQTVHYTALKGTVFGSLPTAGLFGWVMVVLGLAFMVAGTFEALGLV